MRLYEVLVLFAFASCHAWTTTGSTRRNLQSHCCRRPPRTALFSSSSTQQDAPAGAVSREARVQDVLKLARSLGPVGSRQSEEDRQRLVDAALELRELSDPEPSKIPLTGIHNLVYSASPGGSSGQLGPFDGKVTQEFVNEKTFINAVQLGPLKIALTATREIKNDTTVAVKFIKTRFYLFGNQVAEKDVGGGGVWKMVFVGKVQDSDGKEKLVRIMETPSLFVIEQPLN